MNANKQPRNAQDAFAQALRLERARQIVAEGLYDFYPDADSDVVAVVPAGETAAKYWLNMITPGCDCPDGMKGHHCKHEQAWNLLQAEQATELAGYEEQCRRHDAEHGADMPPADTLRAMMLAEYRKAERNLAANPEPFSVKAEASRTRMREVETALRIYDETQAKIACDYYKRGLDRQRA